MHVKGIFTAAAEESVTAEGKVTLTERVLPGAKFVTESGALTLVAEKGGGARTGPPLVMTTSQLNRRSASEPV